MESNDEIMDVLERHWESVDKIACRDNVRVVRWRLPESRRRWAHSIAAAVVVAVAASTLLVTAVPQPGGLYASNLSHRTAAIASIDYIMMGI